MAKKDKTAKKSDKKSKKQSKKFKPKEVKIGKGASPFDVGKAVVEGINRGTPDADLWKKFWSKKARSIEGMGVNMAWDGLKAIDAKCKEWVATHKIYSASAEGPYVGATGFSIKFTMDVEDTSTGKRETMNEVGVYRMKNGKVVEEEFMYRM